MTDCKQVELLNALNMRVTDPAYGIGLLTNYGIQIAMAKTTGATSVLLEKFNTMVSSINGGLFQEAGVAFGFSLKTSLNVAAPVNNVNIQSY